MLESLDVLIGLVVVLLALSMAVTVVTQALTTVVNSRGSHLLQGLADLLQQMDETIGPEHSRAIALAVLRHPLVSGSKVLFTSTRRLGNVVHREEFTKLLMSFAGSGGSALSPDVASTLKTTLARNGVTDPDATLGQIRMRALQLEQKSPALSHAARQTLAVLHAAPSDLVAKINGWFDQSMDRTSQRFTASTRVVTFAAAFVVAFGLQVDTPALVNRLAADPQLRAVLVERATSLPSPESSAAGSTKNTVASVTDAKAESTPPTAARAWARQTLGVAGIVSMPASFEEWQGGFTMSTILGMLITALLLSLGAPFWYRALGQLLQLRSVLATKDDAQRQQRQSTTASEPTQSTIVALPIVEE